MMTYVFGHVIRWYRQVYIQEKPNDINLAPAFIFHYNGKYFRIFVTTNENVCFLYHKRDPTNVLSIMIMRMLQTTPMKEIFNQPSQILVQIYFTRLYIPGHSYTTDRPIIAYPKNLFSITILFSFSKPNFTSTDIYTAHTSAIYQHTSLHQNGNIHPLPRTRHLHKGNQLQKNHIMLKTNVHFQIVINSSFLEKKEIVTCNLT